MRKIQWLLVWFIPPPWEIFTSSSSIAHAVNLSNFSCSELKKVNHFSFFFLIFNPADFGVWCSSACMLAGLRTEFWLKRGVWWGKKEKGSAWKHLWWTGDQLRVDPCLWPAELCESPEAPHLPWNRNNRVQMMNRWIFEIMYLAVSIVHHFIYLSINTTLWAIQICMKLWHHRPRLEQNVYIYWTLILYLGWRL